MQVLNITPGGMRDEEDVSDYDLVMWRGTVEYLHSREVFLRLFGQGSTYSDVYTFRALIGWEYQPDSNIYLAYEQWRDNSESDFRITNQGLFLKVRSISTFLIAAYLQPLVASPREIASSRGVSLGHVPRQVETYHGS